MTEIIEKSNNWFLCYYYKKNLNKSHNGFNLSIGPHTRKVDMLQFFACVLALPWLCPSYISIKLIIGANVCDVIKL